jgi:hypothetical protein
MSVTRRAFAVQVSLVIAVALTVSCSKDGLLDLGGDEPVRPTKQECTYAIDCAADEICEQGQCIPECVGTDCEGGGGGGPIMSVAGDWNTDYHLDWSDYMGPLADLGTPLDFIDQLLMGNSDIDDLPIIGAVIQNIIDTYIPDWVKDLVHFLNAMVHFFQDVRVEGRMTLTQSSGNPAVIGGSEDWDWAYVQMITQCQYGEADPGYPGCATFAIPLNFGITNFGTISTQVLPFDGTFNGTTLFFNDREVQMELADFLRFIIDFGVAVATNSMYDSLEGALTGIIDCVGITAAIEANMCSSFDYCGSLPFVLAACTETRDMVINEILTAVDEVTVDWEVMQFDQRATAFDSPVNGIADKLGNPPSAPGIIEDGEFQMLFDADLPGTWSATR